jgi:hypothetical protein
MAAFATPTYASSAKKYGWSGQNSLPAGMLSRWYSGLGESGQHDIMQHVMLLSLRADARQGSNPQDV